ncbi:CS1 type fimbrial major subunit [Pseudomonas sp. PB106]|uniref:CS1 type fimbrial major subunit n=1 Tax=Pseudomonas sp. PB106 TaxID=2494699 RepID=UPI00131AEA09|nr:CS1 type fimbrial major subunit [Pseudomonas sp. PB106]KAE9638709.1 adhesin [Pseudomonas sp. PB106]
MFKKLAIAASLAGLAMSSSMAFAVEPYPQVINVRAFVPTSLFVIKPQNPDFGRDEVMSQLDSGEMSTIDHIFNLKHTDPKGSINALIDGTASLYNGRDNIPLTVSVGGIELGNTTTEIVNETESVPGVQRTLRIKADTPSATQNGNYTGSFAVVFEPVIKP